MKCFELHNCMYARSHTIMHDVWHLEKFRKPYNTAQKKEKS